MYNDRPFTRCPDNNKLLAIRLLPDIFTVNTFMRFQCVGIGVTENGPINFRLCFRVLYLGTFIIVITAVYDIGPLIISYVLLPVNDRNR